MSGTTPTCQIHKKYWWIECADAALDGDPDAYCILHSQNREKDPEAFQEAVWARCEQEEVEFYDFRGVWFPGPFYPACLSDNLEFTKPADFSGATFTEEANFSRTTFMEEANFSGANFKKVADFSMTTFTKGAYFLGTVFTDRAYFFNATFMEGTNFSGAKIYGRIVFRGFNPRGDRYPPRPPFHGKFTGLELSQTAVLSFQDLSLAKVSFEGTNLPRVEFQHVQWHPYRGRQAIYDEVLLRRQEKEDPWFWTWLCQKAPYAEPPSPWPDRYGEVERLYRDLQENYEQARDYKKMGDFHYGEMEMHRRASKWRWFPFYWYNFYWALSGYGERPSRALGWLAIFLFGLAGLVWGLGLEVGKPPHIADFGDSFIYLLQKVTLQRPTWAEPMGFWGKLVAGLSVLLIPGQAALFLLALRNRLGRRR